MGSAYKKTHRILGMRNIFYKAGILLFCWHFNASGKGEISTIDGHNTAVKAQREMEMKEGYVPACTNIELEFHAQSYNRSIVGSYPVDLAFR